MLPLTPYLTAARSGWDLAMMAWTFPLAIGTTLSHRLPMLVDVPGDLPTRHARERMRMVSEKLDASAEASRALGRGTQKLAKLSISWWTANADDLVALSRSVGPQSDLTQIAKAQMEGLDYLARSSAASMAIANAMMASTVSFWRAPHRRVSANARRLSRRPRR